MHTVIASTAVTVLDYLRVFVWPVLVVGVLAYAVRRYGVNIGNLIDRLKTMKVGLAELGFADASQQTQAADEEAAEERIEEYNDLIAQYEQALQEQAIEANIERATLVRQLALVEVQLDFERTYRIIYGSQINTLRSLRLAPDGLRRPDIEPQLAQSKATWTTIALIQNVTFEQWIGFLVMNELVSAVADRYEITPKGEAFLDYIDALRLSARIF